MNNLKTYLIVINENTVHFIDKIISYLTQLIIKI